VAQTVLGVRAGTFTRNGTPVFLYGMSYYGALGATEEVFAQDLAELHRWGVGWLRVWATWAAFDHDVSAVDGRDGSPREPFLSRLAWLVQECDRRGLIVDITLSRGNGVTGPPRLQTGEAHRRAVETLLERLGQWRNWYLDLANERNIPDRRFVSIEELAELRALVRQRDPQRLVTASHAGDLSREDVRAYVQTVQVDLVCPHRPRTPESPAQTAARAQEVRAWLAELGRVVPLHDQEPFRRGFRPQRWEPPAEAFVTDLAQARAGGAAGWCFHTGHQSDRPDGRPRRSFDLRDGPLATQLDAVERAALAEIVRRGLHRPDPGGDR